MCAPWAGLRLLWGGITGWWAARCCGVEVSERRPLGVKQQHDAASSVRTFTLLSRSSFRVLFGVLYKRNSLWKRVKGRFLILTSHMRIKTAVWSCRLWWRQQTKLGTSCRSVWRDARFYTNKKSCLCWLFACSLCIQIKFLYSLNACVMNDSQLDP